VLRTRGPDVGPGTYAKAYAITDGRRVEEKSGSCQLSKKRDRGDPGAHTRPDHHHLDHGDLRQVKQVQGAVEPAVLEMSERQSSYVPPVVETPATGLKALDSPHGAVV
jgi:hypothetical protein